MLHVAELQFLQKALKRCHLQTLLVGEELTTDTDFDLGLRKQLGLPSKLSDLIGLRASEVQPCTLYRIRDPFLCSYFFLRLPDEQFTLLLIGPYLEESPTSRQLLEQAERNGIPPQNMRQLENYYRGIPVLEEDNAALFLLTTFCETIWGNTAFVVSELDRQQSEALPTPIRQNPDNLLGNMQMMEARYAYENELMEVVSLGLVHKTEAMFGTFSKQAIEERLTDRVRNLKNYCIIMNTLLRKAAEKGGVHPIYLDETSNNFAHRIEQATSVDAIRDLMGTMARAYCLLVKRHTTRGFSPIVQRTIACIDSDLSGDLSLQTLAGKQSISAGYLSSLFRRETGQTLTEHVNQKRIELAKKLLTTTHLQIQTIAQHCGIPDVNYFSKLFKKHTQKTPSDYRQNGEK